MTGLSQSKWATAEPEREADPKPGIKVSEDGHKSLKGSEPDSTTSSAPIRTNANAGNAPSKSSSVSSSNSSKGPVTPTKTLRGTLASSRWASVSPESVTKSSSESLKHVSEKKPVSKDKFEPKKVSDITSTPVQEQKQHKEHKEDHMSPEALSFARRLGIPGDSKESISDDKGFSADSMEAEREKYRAKKLAKSGSLEWNKKPIAAAHEESTSRRSSGGSGYGTSSSSGSVFSNRSAALSVSESDDDLFSHRMPARQNAGHRSEHKVEHKVERKTERKTERKSDRKAERKKDHETGSRMEQRSKASKDSITETSEEIRAKAAAQYELLASGNINWDEE